MKFGNLKLYKNRPTIIAEVGVNHECKYKNVYKLINDAKKHYLKNYFVALNFSKNDILFF